MLVIVKKIYKNNKKEASRFALTDSRRKLIRPGAHGKCPRTIVIVGYT